MTVEEGTYSDIESWMELVEEFCYGWAYSDRHAGEPTESEQTTRTDGGAILA